MADWDILHEDNEVLVVYKPAGLATQSAKPTEKDLESELKNYRVKKGEDPYIGVVHRLDQPVEGVLCFAKTRAAMDALTKQLREHTLMKKYYAIITRGNMPTQGVLEDYLVKDGRKQRAMVVKETDPRAKKARLTYRVISEVDDMRLLDITIESGRFHQIRAQLASRTAPIYGDVKYGGVSTGRPLCLCAYYLRFAHPKTGAMMEYEIHPKGEDFYDLLP
jgi:23S rRNA pseudouridine1911/1915/1917 synthase